MEFELDSEIFIAIDHYEKIYGTRDQKYRILGVSFHDLPFPQILVSEDTATVEVKLDVNAKGNILRLKYQIWHEAVHCLAPVARMDTLWFEEGLAVALALSAPFMNRNYRRLCIKQLSQHPIWFAPYQAFMKLKATAQQIRVAHELAPERKFDLLDQAALIEIFKISDDLADSLCKRLSSTR